ncbi:MAG TPA: FecR domain-containing protein [Puia sp.]|jgi:ferric-dicitrate binding protein FerR (iron transport regulator)
MEEQKLWELLGKKITGEANAAELEELNRLLEKFPETLYTLETMQSYWRSSDEKADILQREAALERHLQRLPVEDAKPRQLGSYRRYLIGAAAAAAVFTGCLLLLPALWKKTEQPSLPAPRQMAVTTKGERRRLQLPDGSAVWLNAGTTIQYTQRPGIDSLREVSLSGEAYFEVKHDAAHPFIVHARQMEIRDLGTSFNVKAYPLDRTSEATLVEGSIDIRLNKEKGGAVLTKPNQKFIAYVRSGNGSILPENPDNAGQTQALKRETIPETFRVSAAVAGPVDSTLAETAWMKNMLVFRNESFADLAVRLERWYDVSIHFTDQGQARYRFTGVLADETLQQALQELQLMKPFHFSISGETVSIEK